MNARERQVKQVQAEMLCEEIGHSFTFGSDACVSCGKPYCTVAEHEWDPRTRQCMICGVSQEALVGLAPEELEAALKRLKAETAPGAYRTLATQREFWDKLNEAARGASKSMSQFADAIVASPHVPPGTMYAISPPQITAGLDLGKSPDYLGDAVRFQVRQDVGLHQLRNGAVIKNITS